MTSNLFSLNTSDLIKGLVMAIATPLVASLYAAMQLPGFDFMAFDWKHLVGLGVVSGIAYLMKNFLSDNQGKVLGKIG